VTLIPFYHSCWKIQVIHDIHLGGAYSESVVGSHKFPSLTSPMRTQGLRQPPQTNPSLVSSVYSDRAALRLSSPIVLEAHSPSPLRSAPQSASADGSERSVPSPCLTRRTFGSPPPFSTARVLRRTTSATTTHPPPHPHPERSQPTDHDQRAEPDKLMERCSDGVEDQGAEDALRGMKTSKRQPSQFWKEPPHASGSSFQPTPAGTKSSWPIDDSTDSPPPQPHTPSPTPSVKDSRRGSTTEQQLDAERTPWKMKDTEVPFLLHTITVVALAVYTPPRAYWFTGLLGSFWWYRPGLCQCRFRVGLNMDKSPDLLLAKAVLLPSQAGSTAAHQLRCSGARESE
jgi:hypothetical protein